MTETVNFISMGNLRRWLACVVSFSFKQVQPLSKIIVGIQMYNFVFPNRKEETKNPQNPLDSIPNLDSTVTPMKQRSLKSAYAVHVRYHSFHTTNDSESKTEFKWNKEENTLWKRKTQTHSVFSYKFIRFQWFCFKFFMCRQFSDWFHTHSYVLYLTTTVIVINLAFVAMFHFVRLELRALHFGRNPSKSFRRRNVTITLKLWITNEFSKENVSKS